MWHLCVCVICMCLHLSSTHTLIFVDQWFLETVGGSPSYYMHVMVSVTCLCLGLSCICMPVSDVCHVAVCLCSSRLAKCVS